MRDLGLIHFFQHALTQPRSLGGYSFFTSTSNQQPRSYNSESCPKGFIKHPLDYPYHLTPSEHVMARQQNDCVDGELGGVVFEMAEPYEAGTVLELEISIRGNVDSFHGQVVFVRNRGTVSDVGFWLQHGEDLNRLRMVEQLCFIESYRNRVYQADGRQLSSQRAACEWIEKYAGTFPAL